MVVAADNYKCYQVWIFLLPISFLKRDTWELSEFSPGPKGKSSLITGPSFPRSKSSHCTAQYQDKIIVTGGNGDTDTWVFDSLKLDNFRYRN